MFAIGNQFQIFDSIIRSIPILVMYVFVGFKLTTKIFSHHYSMFISESHPWKKRMILK